MYQTEYFLVFPEGDKQEIQHPLQFNAVVDMNGNRISFPLRNERQILYRVYKVSTNAGRFEEQKFYHVESLTIEEIRSLNRSY